MKKPDYKFIFLIIILCGLVFLLGWLTHLYFPDLLERNLTANENTINISQNSSVEDENIVNISQNSSAEKIAEYLQKELKKFYHYNISNIDNDRLSLEDLKQQGGVCYHYAEWYRDNALPYVDGVITPIISINKTMNHEFTIISKNKEFCLLDQKKIFCWS